jgi:hypothetical protein
LCKLAEKTRAARARCADDVYEKVVGESTLSTVVGRLRENLPSDLEMQIVKGPKATMQSLPVRLPNLNNGGTDQTGDALTARLIKRSRPIDF